jgi:hypothetical protein
MKDILLDTWFGFSIFIWALNILSLIMLPKMLWDWFYLLPLFVGTTINLIIAINVFLNRLNKLNNL